jgi:hypothetical protein
LGLFVLELLSFFLFSSSQYHQGTFITNELTVWEGNLKAQSKDEGRVAKGKSAMKRVKRTLQRKGQQRTLQRKGQQHTLQRKGQQRTLR